MKETGIMMSGYAVLPCQRCGRERRVQLLAGEPRNKLCRSCVGLGRHPSKATIAKISRENSTSWKGGRQDNGDGYILVKLQPDDVFRPMADKRGYILEHRLVMARSLNRPLQPWEIVHHKNGIRDDNRIQNLRLTVRGSHNIEHSKGYRHGYREGYQDAQNAKIEQLLKQIKLLQWQVRNDRTSNHL